MIYKFNTTYNNIYHFTTESILRIIDSLPNFKSGDVIVVPDFPTYPHNLIEKIIENCEMRIEEALHPRIYPDNYKGIYDVNKVRKYCAFLISHIEKKPVKSPSIYMSFRLHKRRWLPISNIQKLVDKLKDKYTILLSLNPKCEGVTNVPEITGVTKIYDLSYEEQLSYAASADYAIYGNGAGMIFARVAGLPSVQVTGCAITETIPIGSYYGLNEVVLSDKKPDHTKQWDKDIEKVTVDQVLEAFEKATKLPRL